jgi:hypothetical protein
VSAGSPSKIMKFGENCGANMNFSNYYAVSFSCVIVAKDYNL